MKEYHSLILLCSLLVLVIIPVQVRAHCDTLDGPVVATAKAALEKGDIIGSAFPGPVYPHEGLEEISVCNFSCFRRSLPGYEHLSESFFDLFLIIALHPF